MRKLTKSISAILFSLILLFSSSIITVSAAKDELTVDGKLAYKVGDTITYDLCLQSPEGIMGVQMYITYDQEYLKLNTESVEAPVLSDATINPNISGEIILIRSNIRNLGNFIEKGTLIKAEFEVLKAGETNIECFFEEMYSSDLTYIKEYTTTVNYSQNGTVVKDDDPPIINDDPDFVDEHQGQFPNYSDGKGEKNTDVDDNRTIVTSPNKVNDPPANNNANSGGNGNQNTVQRATDANGNVVATNAQGETLPTDASGNYLAENGETLATDASGNYVDGNGNIYQDNTTALEQNKVDFVPIIIIIAVVLAAIAIVIIIVVKSKGSNIPDDLKKEENIIENKINNKSEEDAVELSNDGQNTQKSFEDTAAKAPENTENPEKTEE